jgi:hypothetical protein
MKIWGAKGDALADHQIGSDGCKSGHETDAVIRSFMTHSVSLPPSIDAVRKAYWSVCWTPTVSFAC